MVSGSVADPGPSSRERSAHSCGGRFGGRVGRGFRSRAGNAVARDPEGCPRRRREGWRRGASGGYGFVTMGNGLALAHADEPTALFARIRT